MQLTGAALIAATAEAAQPRHALELLPPLPGHGAALSVFGFGAVLKLQTGKSLEGHRVAPMTNGFGSSFHGGTKQ